ncbi:hypothetical protein FNF29_06879 [Cafeteria roenbergensis]|uniref:Enoyl reductase (ER) domain-containing protein n=1 Tax=Cafeteria roenbergensis TaxID=33653 RepID=A0A5A8C5T2_CAFRO|nr:hypothetical protein FNF29_06879 [Cafeteria roenbergensis]|eukprot:KAA0148084.1 hypothetical protein FNF29_06879 [Cafeteria roenbergensis]
MRLRVLGGCVAVVTVALMASTASATDGPLPTTMRALVAKPGADGTPAVEVVDRPVPVPGPAEVLLRVVATGTNRAEIMQAAGKVPLPAGATDIMGLEAAGVVVALGSDAASLSTAGGAPPAIGLRAIAIVTGGGQAEFVCVPVTALVPVPAGLPLEVAAALPEQWTTAYQLLFEVGGLDVAGGDETVVVYAAGSGVGTAALQLLRMTGRRSVAVAGRADKLAKAAELGAAVTVNYKEDAAWADTVAAAVPGGAHLVLDCVGGSFFESTAKLLRTDGVWVLYGLLGGPSAPGPALGMLLRKRIQLRATTLRARSDAYKAGLAAGLAANVMPRIAAPSAAATSVSATGDAAPAGSAPLRPVIEDTLDGLDAVAEAFARMRRSENLGKYVIRVAAE